MCCLYVSYVFINPLNAELIPICYLLALLAHHFLHVSRIRVKSLTLRLLMSYIYIYDISNLRVNLGGIRCRTADFHFSRLSENRPCECHVLGSAVHEFLSLFFILVARFGQNVYFGTSTPCDEVFNSLLTLRRLMSYIYIYVYGASILDVSRSHTTTQHSR